MSKDLLEIFQKSEELLNHLNNPFVSGGDEGDSYISQLENLLNERGNLIQSNKINIVSAEDKKLAARLMEISIRIEEKVEALKNQVKFDINHMNKKKKTNRKYENPYDGPTTDGVFFDKRGI
ncbi:hypothetical protein BTR22_05150 [Alkalihalophilus pseudofirmus]|uniref:hypothetical protein n=1 Tax=Alkalihalophilus pseudofirmus TaxID=79885 RepID=UPI00095173DE|nr:hypothetical protein BTR22_05150 [Alkalihalophilus pseudofirmus]